MKSLTLGPTSAMNWTCCHRTLNETRDDLPTGYPVDATVAVNERIAYVIADNGLTLGPAKMLPVHKDQRVQGAVNYFYTEDAPGASYSTLQSFINEVLVSIVASSSALLPTNEAQLMAILDGTNQVAPQLTQFLSTHMDTTDMSRPHAYLVYLLYDNNFNIVPASSGALRVENPNHLEQLLTQPVEVTKDGFLHVYVSNGSAGKGVSFDNFLITSMRGKTRQINHYYPYGLRISGMDGYTHDYKNMYTGKELQTGEFNSFVSTGLEMYDFHARFYDPQLGRWFTPDPAEQFSNPYLAMGNNPVMYVDPDGEFVLLALAGAAIVGGYIGASIQQGTADFTQWDNTWGQAAITGAMLGVATVATAGKAGLLGAKMSAGMTKFANAKTAKILSKTMGGGLNMMNHHDADRGFGAHSLGYFAAGFFGTHYGIKGGMAKGFAYGGGFNVVAGGLADNIDNGYDSFQHFVGGGLSAVAGTNMYKSFGSKWINEENVSSWREYTALKDDPWSNFAADKLGASKQWTKKFYSYGFQNLAGSFAYDSDQNFFQRDIGQHLGVFWIGGVGGASQDWLMGQKLRLAGLDAPTKVLGSTLLFAGEYALTYFYQRSFPNSISVSWDSYSNYKRSSYMFKSFGFGGF